MQTAAACMLSQQLQLRSRAPSVSEPEPILVLLQACPLCSWTFISGSEFWGWLTAPCNLRYRLGYASPSCHSATVLPMCRCGELATLDQCYFEPLSSCTWQDALKDTEEPRCIKSPTMVMHVDLSAHYTRPEEDSLALNWATCCLDASCQ